ncbi:hypothetical protein BGX26_003589 [Mortierella sp. AD094]|nr:hypothetical protein BGX26_003589 [Mortierella sp. AD094]
MNVFCKVSKKYSGYSSATHGDINMADQEEAVHVSLLEPEQFYLSAAHSANNSPLLPNGRQPTVAAVRDRGGRPLNYPERPSDEVDITDASQHQDLTTSAIGGARGIEFEHNDPWSGHDSSSSTHPPPMPPLQPIQRRQQHQYQDHTVVQMTDDRLNARAGRSNYGEGGGRRDYDGDNEDNEPLGRSITRFTVKRDGKMRYCQKCQFEKPDRTHHWYATHNRIAHCPWLNNCVGHKNYKAFFLFVLWTSIYCVTIVACTIPVAAVAEENAFDPQWIFMILVGMIFGLCLVPFAIHHLLLIKSNKTTIESFEKHKYRVGNRGEVMQSRVLNVFDLGRKKNFIQVLGPVWYLWLIPVRNSIGDGWSFPASDYGKSMLSRDNESLAPSNLSQWTPRTSTSQLTLHRTQYQDHHGSGDSNAGGDSSHEAFDVNDASDLDRDHYRRDSDESDNDDDPQRRRFQPTPRRFRNQQRAGFSLTADSDDEEAEEYIYDSDEPITIRFTDKGR